MSPPNHAALIRCRPPMRCLHGAVFWLLLAGGAVAAPAPEIAWRLLGSHPHDNAAFTQGLLWHDGALFESTGLYGRSQVRRVDPGSGRILARRRLAADLFGEGLALAGAQLYQLTWRSGRGFVYRASDLEPLREFRYRGEGWGLAFDGRRLFMSDGSATLRVLEPEGFRQVAQVRVHDDGAPVTLLNELEFVEGQLYANVWRSDRVARIDPDSGRVTGWLDLSGLLSPLWSASVDVLNGIAWDSAQRRLWVTGKLWPRIFVLEIADDAAARGHSPAVATPGPVR